MDSRLYPDKVIRTGDHVVTAMCHLQLSQPTDKLNRQLIVAGTETGDVVVWNLSTQVVVQTVHTESTMVLSTLPLRHCNAVVVYTRGQKVMILQWCEESRQLLVKLSSQLEKSLCPTFCPISVMSTQAGLCCMSVPAENDVLLYSIHTEDVYDIRDMKAQLKNSALVTCMATFSASADIVCVLVGDEAGVVSLYSLDYGKHHRVLTSDKSTNKQTNTIYQPICTLNTHDKEPVLTIDYNSTSHIGVSAGGAGRVSVWKCVDSELSKHLHIQTPSKGFNAVRLRSDSKLLLLCAWDGVVRLYSPKSGKLLALLDFHRQSVTAATFDIDNHFVTSSKDNLLCLWSLYAGK